MPDPETLLEQWLELLAVEDDITPNARQPSIPDPRILEWNWIDAPLHIHTARTPAFPVQAEQQTERIAQFDGAPHPCCWIGLSVGWPHVDASFRRFGMVHSSPAPYVTIGTSEFALPRVFQCRRTPLGSLNGIPEHDAAPSSTLFYRDSLLPFPSPLL